LERFRWKARASLYGSPEVDRLWHEWLEIVISQWHIVANPELSARLSELMDERESRLAEARAAIIAQMRRELDTWDG